MDGYEDYISLFQGANKEESGNTADTWNDNEEELFDTLGTQKNMEKYQLSGFLGQHLTKKKFQRRKKFICYQLSSYSKLNTHVIFVIERKPKTEDKQTIAMLRSKIYTLEQELEQQKNQKVC